MNRLNGKGTVPETGEGMALCGSLSISGIELINQNLKGQVTLELDHGGYLIDLFFSRSKILKLKEMIEEFFKAGISQPKKGERPEDRHDFNVGLDASVAEISVEVLPPIEDDCAFCYLNLKDRWGNKASIDLNLDAAREIRKKLDAYFTAERSRQEARLA